MLGGDDIYATLSGIARYRHERDRGHCPGRPASITLEHAECLAACDYAPVVTVNYEFFDNQSDRIGHRAWSLSNCSRQPASAAQSRGAPLCSFKEISRQIAGFVDDSA